MTPPLSLGPADVTCTVDINHITFRQDNCRPYVLGLDDDILYRLSDDALFVTSPDMPLNTGPDDDTLTKALS
jgi:hypothetical protein